ncbi:MAG: protein-L-isoaspartate(D-aspartate) O-methyltransferase [Cytophagales bacterium]|nr:protein-L-isoaspartate(D-aspartate) O-methyltransferase [Cytophagales bacterium]
MKPTCILILFLIGWQTDTYQEQRNSMVASQLENRNIRDESTLQAMRKVPRHRFVPKEQQRYAYEDRPLPIGYGQTISQPYMVAFMTEVIKPQKDFKVLEIGTGSGYQAAVLAEIVDKVYTVEIVPELANQAEKRFEGLGYSNVKTIEADGYFGWEEFAPFDAIVVTAAAEFIPPPLISQLKEGGKMVIPVGSPFLVQTLMLVEKKKGKTTTKSLFPVRFVPFTRGN